MSSYSTYEPHAVFQIYIIINMALTLYSSRVLQFCKLITPNKIKSARRIKTRAANTSPTPLCQKKFIFASGSGIQETQHTLYDSVLLLFTSAKLSFIELLAIRAIVIVLIVPNFFWSVSI